MKTTFGRLIAALGILALATGAAAAQSKVKVSIAVGGAGCLCYLPTVLAKELGEYDKAGVEVELIDFKGGSQALQAVIGGSADVVSGYYDHCVNLAAKGQSLQSFVIYDRYPGMVLAVSPEAKDIKSIKDLAGKAVGVSAPGSSTDFFLKYLLAKNGMDPTSTSVVGIGLAATAVAAMEHGKVNAAVMLDPAATLMQNKYKENFRLLSDTRTAKDTLDVFGGEYPGGALYTRADWITKNEATTQKLTNAIIATLKWIHSHTPEEIMAKMPDGAGRAGQGALSRGAQEHDPDVFADRPDGPEGRAGRARGVQPVGAGNRQGEHRPLEDLHQPLRRGGQQGHVTGSSDHGG